MKCRSSDSEVCKRKNMDGLRKALCLYPGITAKKIILTFVVGNKSATVSRNVEDRLTI